MIGAESMRILKLNSISKKVCFLVSLIIIVSLVGISLFNYSISKRELSRSNNIILSNAIEFIMVEVNRNHKYSQDESQWMTEEDVKAFSLAAIGDLTGKDTDGVSGATSSDDTDADSSATINSIYGQHAIDLGESGYYFIIDSQGNIISHPFLKDNIYNLKSKDGRHIIQDIINTAKSGGGTLTYSLEEGISIIEDTQIVYTKFFPHWDWVIGAVIYDNELARGSDIILFNNMIATIAVLILAIAITILLTNRTFKPIKSITKALSGISEGDLTVDHVHIDTNDEMKLLGNSTNKLIASLNKILKTMKSSSDSLSKYSGDIKESSTMVSEATTEVAEAISQIAVQSDEQYRDIVESVESVTLFGDSIKETAEASSKIGSVVEKNVELKELGLVSVQELKDASKENNENTAIIEELVHEMNKSSIDIGEITVLISNVAKQTNLLALNASIEASRAGEHGTGFAVVAEEIRKLANETATAVNDINSKIEQMQSQTKEVVNSISKNRQGVDRINESVSKTEQIIGMISDSLQDLIEDIRLIVDHNQVLNNKKDEILDMLGNVSDSAQANSAAVEEISATAQEQSVTLVIVNDSIVQLNNMVIELNKIINEFKVNN